MDRMKIHPELRKAARFLPPLPIHRYWLLKTMRFVLPKFMGERPVPRGIAVSPTSTTQRFSSRKPLILASRGQKVGTTAES